MKKLNRSHIEDIKTYEPGKPIEEVQRELGIKNVIKMASNENPLGPSPKALARARKALGSVNRYPDSACFYLRKALAKKHRVNPENIIVGNGSDELIVLALRAFTGEGDEVIIAEPTFLIYKIAAKAVGAKPVVVPMKNLKYDLRAIKKAITPRTKLIFIANPDNPTGTYVNRKEVADFLKGISDDVIIFFDEAYFEFAPKDFPNTLQYLESKNVIVARSFSKAYGLAGLRIGYAVSRPEFINYLNKVREPFNVNLLAQEAALGALKDEKFLKKTIKSTEEGKKYLYGRFQRLGLRYIPSATNFILLNVDQDSKEVFEKMLQKGVIIRSMKAWGLDSFIRVTVGTKKENQRFIIALREVLGI